MAATTLTYYKGFTLSEAQEQLALWKECAKELATGQAKRYRIGTREFEAIDLEEVYAMIQRFAEIVSALDGTSRSRRVQVVVPRF
jgi:transposase-like protein